MSQFQSKTVFFVFQNKIYIFGSFYAWLNFNFKMLQLKIVWIQIFYAHKRRLTIISLIKYRLYLDNDDPLISISLDVKINELESSQCLDILILKAVGYDAGVRQTKFQFQLLWASVQLHFRLVKEHVPLLKDRQNVRLHLPSLDQP